MEPGEWFLEESADGSSELVAVFVVLIIGIVVSYEMRNLEKDSSQEKRRNEVLY
jgi:hypothetical protein